MDNYDVQLSRFKLDALYQSSPAAFKGYGACVTPASQLSILMCIVHFLSTQCLILICALGALMQYNTKA